MNFITKIRQEINQPIIIRIPIKRSFAIGNIIFSGQDRAPDIIVHEKVHVEQQKHAFVSTWLLRYVLDSNFRWRMEREAITQQMLYRQSNNMPTDYTKLYNSIMNDYNSMVDANTARDYIFQIQNTDRVLGSVYLQ